MHSGQSRQESVGTVPGESWIGIRARSRSYAVASPCQRTPVSFGVPVQTERNFTTRAFQRCAACLWNPSGKYGDQTDCSYSRYRPREATKERSCPSGHNLLALMQNVLRRCAIPYSGDALRALWRSNNKRLTFALVVRVSCGVSSVVRTSVREFQHSRIFNDDATTRQHTDSLYRSYIDRT